MSIPKKQIIVIGGGPAGLMAAGQAALRGARVTLLEKKDQPALKLRITGNGRCNLTNMAALDQFLSHFGRNGKFLRPAFAKFFEPQLWSFFEGNGVRLLKDDRGRVYPKSNDANEIAEALTKWANRCGVYVIYDSPVKQIIVEDKHISGVRLNNAVKEADSIVIATGGASYPSTGSSGDGYTLARSLGHTIIPIRPASVPLKTSSPIVPKLSGISINSAQVNVKADGKLIVSDSGDLLFTHFGVSGPVILNISRHCVDLILKGKQPTLIIDLLPGYNEKELDRMLLSKMQSHGKGQIQTILSEYIPHKMAALVLPHNGIEPDKICSQISTGERGKIRHILKAFELQITGHRSYESAMVTAGGVSLKEVEPKSMESRLVRGLYFAGEVLDLDADTGGFNLQAAFSTGWIAGRACAVHSPKN
jgi:predicted Rossmann fold flavoprotein